MAESRADLVLCTGDLTATATAAEFSAAKVLLAPLTQAPFLCIPGNHDVYTGESVGRYAEYFGVDPAVESARFGEIDIIRVDACHPDWLSRGRLGESGIKLLERVLASGEAPALVAMHYPLRNRQGERYGPATRAMVDAEAVEATLQASSRVRWVVHGHEHHGYRVEIPRPGGPILSINPGSSGYAYLPAQRRTAHFCIYEFAGEEMLNVERYAFNGDCFVPEEGGSFATGR